jgi:NADH:ubiquinone oxidoreductase subunit H
MALFHRAGNSRAGGLQCPARLIADQEVSVLILVSSLVFFLNTVSILVAVSFFTLFERKLLSSRHLRLGPTLVGPYGLLQPFRDAIKLFSKEVVWLRSSNYTMYLLAAPAAVR